MKVLLYSSSFLLPDYNSSAVVLEHAISLDKKGYEVHYLSCDGALKGCLANINGNVGICKLCKLNSRRWKSKLPDTVVIHSLSHYVNESIKLEEFNYSSSESLKNLKYKGVDIGYAVMSTYITTTRNLNPEINKKTKPFFDNLLNQGVILTNGILKAINDIKPKRIGFFNGRIIDTKPVRDVAKSLGIGYEMFELVGGFGEGYSKKIFNNGSPFDIKFIEEEVNKTWEELEEKQKEDANKRVEKFFDNRKTGKPAGDKIYIEGQKQGLLPDNWDRNKQNIVIFNSSEDEFAAISEEFDSYRIFKDQIEGVKFIANSFLHDEKYHFYLRIHPNLKSVTYSYHSDLIKLGVSFDNLTIILSDERVSTYDLMEQSDKVVVFGSTMGIEANYWGKPVILIGPSMYYGLNACYKPSCPDELMHLVREPKLLPKDKLESIKFCYYITKPEEGDSKFKYFNVNYKIDSMFGFTFRRLMGQKLLGSGNLYSLFYKVIKKLYKSYGKCFYKSMNYPTPLNEA